MSHGHYGHCISCYHHTKGYCSLHDIDVNRRCGCNEHITLDEAIEANNERFFEDNEDNENE